MKLSELLSEMVCGVTGHEMILENGRFTCMHCPKESIKIDESNALSAGDRQRLYEELLDAEMRVSGGG